MAEKKYIQFAHDMLKNMTKIYAAEWIDIVIIHEEQTIGSRKLDLVGEKIVDDVKYKIFFEVESSSPTSKYIDEYLDFLKEQKAFGGYLIAPVNKRESRYWDDPRFQYRRELQILPVKEIYQYLLNHYYFEIGVLNERLVITLIPTS
jgi:hypothetical protein